MQASHVQPDHTLVDAIQADWHRRVQRLPEQVHEPDFSAEAFCLPDPVSASDVSKLCS